MFSKQLGWMGAWVQLIVGLYMAVSMVPFPSMSQKEQPFLSRRKRRKYNLKKAAHKDLRAYGKKGAEAEEKEKK